MRRRRRSRRWLWLALFSLLASYLGSRVALDHPRPPVRDDAVDPTRYDREQWRHWSDLDRDCQNTRQEVLIEESEVPVRFRGTKTCTVVHGRWRCPYTGRVLENPRDVDVDHLVPLANAHRNGAASWSRATKERYANGLDDADHLVVVHRSANRAKGSKGPEAWLPEHAPSRCGYVEDWVRIKKRWGLSMTRDEERAIARIRRTCDAGRVPPAPQHG